MSTRKRAREGGRRVSHAEIAAMVHNYLRRHGFEGARRAFLKDAHSLLGTFGRGGPPTRTKDLASVIEEYVEMKEASQRRSEVDPEGVLGKMQAVIDETLTRRARAERATTATTTNGRRETAREVDSERDGGGESDSGDIVEREVLPDTPVRRKPSPANANANAASRRKRGGNAPRRFVPGQGPTATNAPSDAFVPSAPPSASRRTPVALGTVGAASAADAAAPPLGSLRPFFVPRIENDAARHKMADVIVNAIGGRGRVMASDIATADEDAPVIDEACVDSVVQSLLDEEDGELGDFIHAMMDGVQASMEGQRANDANDVDHFASPSRRR